ncbi:MAG: hypothetical protein VYD54_05050, partial [Bdellovibrionota bacterium]|nr:hypothetical protein [Bdellovibrionota bacterium]
MRCPLCEKKRNSLYFKNKRREFYRCETCQLTFVPHTFHLTQLEEKKRYLHHENSSEDSGYTRFLKTLTDPLIKLLVPKRDFLGLDFGCGPSETLASLMEEKGYNFNSFDPYFKNKKELLGLKYDAITCSEAIMTQLNSFEKKISEWWYIRDLTHISFFQKRLLNGWPRGIIYLPHFMETQLLFSEKRSFKMIDLFGITNCDKV